MPKSEQSHVKRLHKQGKQLAKANKACAGTRNDKGQFYKCLARESRNIFSKSSKTGSFEIPKDVEVHYSKKVDVGEVSTELGKPTIDIYLNPEIKADPAFHQKVIAHEVIEGTCNRETAKACHEVAKLHEKMMNEKKN